MGFRAGLRTLAMAALGLMLAAGCSASGKPPASPVTGDAFMGSADAKVVVTEYAAPTCPICKRWHDEIFPRLKTQYIDTGKVKFVLKEFPSHNPAVDAAIFAIARCSGPDNYFKVIDGAFARRDDIEKASLGPSGPRGALADLAGTVGIKGDAVEACLRDPEAPKHIFAVQDEGSAKGVTGTPTVFINDKVVSESDTFNGDNFMAAVTAAVNGEAAPAAPAPAEAPAPAAPAKPN